LVSSSSFISIARGQGALARQRRRKRKLEALRLLNSTSGSISFTGFFKGLTHFVTLVRLLYSTATMGEWSYRFRQPSWGLSGCR
jgi:hypothetical protein